MTTKHFTITSNNGYYDYPLPEGAPFRARITLKGVSAPEEVERYAAAGPFVLLGQIHSRRVIEGATAARYPGKDQADGILLTPGDPCSGLRFGDCAPVIILSMAEHPWCLLLHSGFPGTSKNITESGMQLAREKYGALDPERLFAWVGPCISGKCYSRKLDDPATQEALKTFIPEAIEMTDEYAFFDLKRQITHQLCAEGLREDHIFIETQCTCCQSDLFYSHRRQAGGYDPRMLVTVQPF